MYALMCLLIPLFSECLVAHITVVLALLLEVSESTLQNNRKKNMRIPAGRYVSFKPQSNEMFSWYGAEG
jgi:hypothetical protein